MSQRYNDNIKRPKPRDVQLGIFTRFVGEFSRRPHVQERVLLTENAPKNLVVQEGRVQLEHGSHIVKVGVEATCLQFNPWNILKETNKLVGPFRTMPQEPRRPGKEAKLDRVIQFNCGKCAPMLVVKQPEHGRTSTTEEQKSSSFQMN